MQEGWDARLRRPEKDIAPPGLMRAVLGKMGVEQAEGTAGVDSDLRPQLRSHPTTHLLCDTGQVTASLSLSSYPGK